MNNGFFNFLDCISNVIDLINGNFRFVAVGWYKHGVINDKAIVEGKNKNSNGFNNNIKNDEL